MKRKAAGPKQDGLIKALRQAHPEPEPALTRASRARVDAWYADSAPVIHWDRWSSPIGPLFMAATERGLLRISFVRADEDPLEELDPRARVIRSRQALGPYRQELKDYFDGRRLQFDLALDLTGTTAFQRSVLMAIQSIPAGAVQTYRQVARAIRKPQASRAVGQALGSNPLPIVLPCHRVIASDGSLGGYAGGLDIKRKLLKLEGAQLF